MPSGLRPRASAEDEFRQGFDACRCKNFEKFVFLSAELHRAAVDRGFDFLSADVLRTRGFGSRLFIYIKTGLRLASLFRLVRHGHPKTNPFRFDHCFRFHQLIPHVR